MAMNLRNVVPFGRSLAEYRAMFALSEDDLAGRILGAGDGPASFNAEASAAGARVVSVDPVYQFSAADIEARFRAVVDDIIEQVRATPQDWVWTWHESPDGLRRAREEVLRRFVADYETGRDEGRYVAASLPRLPFADDAFDLALCSHFLFLYSDHFDAAFHLAAVAELLRVAREVRLFPLLTLGLEPSPHLSVVTDGLRAAGHHVRIEEVGYELQRGGNQMMRIRCGSAAPSDCPRA